MMPILLAWLLLLPVGAGRYHEVMDLLAEPTFAIDARGEIVHAILAGDSYRITPTGRLERLRRSRLPCPLSSVIYIGERLLISRPAWSREWMCWYHFPPDTGWVPVEYIPPGYFVPDWEAWRADQVRVDRETTMMLQARDEYVSMWERR